MVGAMQDLPPPMSGHQLEISFRRLLKSCEDITSGDNKGRTDLDDWPTSPVFHHYMETLQEQLADVENLPNQRVDAGTLSMYRQHVEDISSKLKPVKLPAFSRSLLDRNKQNTNVPPSAPSSSQPPAGPHEARPISPVKPTASVAAGGAELRNRAARQLTGPLDDTTKDTINRHQNLQDALTDEMVELAAGLKRNARAMQQSVQNRGQLLDDTENAIDSSLMNAKKSSKESKAMRVKGSVTLCTMLLVIFMVSMGFAGTYIFIKSTSFLGYKARL